MANALDAIASKGKRVGYVRVSSVDQNTERQLAGISLDKVFTDKASGRDTNRPQLQACLDYLREDDTLVVHSMDRLARNVEDLLRVVNQLVEKGVTASFIKENLTFSGAPNPMNKLMLTLLGAFAEFERNLIRERQREGIEIAKGKGVYKGRAPALNKGQINQLYSRVDEGIPKAQVAREFKISRSALYSYLDQRDAH